jgi:hypothetical protein
MHNQHTRDHMIEFFYETGFCVHTVITELASFRQLASMQYEACKSGGQGLGMYTCSSLDIAWLRTDARTPQSEGGLHMARPS